MSLRIPVNQFGSSISGSCGKELNRHHANKLFVNQTGDVLTGDLHMNNNKITIDEDNTQGISVLF